MKWGRRHGRTTTGSALLLATLCCGTAQAAPSPGARDAPAQAAHKLDEGQPPDTRTPGDHLRVELLTFGPGDHPFTAFGHNALRIRDEQTGQDVVYNFGTFNFDSPLLAVDFMKGKLRYWLSRSSYAATVFVYERENRTIATQVLALAPQQKLELARRLEENARPENREYRYDYFRDNCSTRVRDALDGVLGGQLRAATSGPGRLTLREHALRMAAATFPFHAALSIVLGPTTDRPITEWAEGFLPEMLQTSVRKVTLRGDGATRPLVASEQVIFSAQRPPPHRDPPSWAGGYLIVGLGLGVLLLGLGAIGAGVGVARFGFGVVVAALGTLFGFVGCFLVAAWALTPHAVVYRNENVLLFAPFALALAVYGLGTAFGRRGAIRKAYLLSGCAVGLASADAILKVFPWARQDNLALLALLLPIWIGMALGARVLTNRTT